MKKNFFKKKLASALALALVVASFSPAGISAQAATSTKIVKQGGGTAPAVLYVNAAKVDYSLSVIKTGVKYTWKSSNTKIATITASTGVVTAKAPGSVTITATATDKKTGKVLNTFKKTLTVNLRSDSVEAGDDFTLATGETKKLAATLTPSNSTDVINYVSSDKNVATVGLTGGLVTAKDAGEATITVYAKATKASSNKSTKTKVDTIKVTVPVGITEVKQVSDVSFTLAFNKNVKDTLKASELALKNSATNAVQAIKGISFSDDGKVVTVTTYLPLTNKAEYTLTYAEKDLKFTASVGEVASVVLETTQIAFGTDSAIKFSFYDANGIKLTNVSDSKVSVAVETTGGYTTGTGSSTKLNLYAKGNTATVTITYHTWTYENGAEKTVSVKGTVVAVDPSEVTIGAYEKYTISGNSVDWTKDSVTTIAVNDTGKYVYLRVKNSAGAYVAAADITYTSADPSVLLVGSTGTLVPVKAGATYVIAKVGTTSFTLPVTVLAARETGAIALDKQSVAVSNTTLVTDSAVIAASATDQYGSSLTASVTAVTNADGTAVTAIDYDLSSAGKIIIKAKGKTAGTYGLLATVNGKKINFSVTVQNANTSPASLTTKLVLSTNTVDTVIGSNTTVADKAVTIKLAQYNNGVLYNYLSASQVTVTTPGAVSVDITPSFSDGVYTYDTLTASTPVAKAAKGTYTVTVTNAGNTYTGYFNVTDTQTAPTFAVDKVTSTLTEAAGATTIADDVLTARNADGNELQIVGATVARATGSASVVIKSIVVKEIINGFTVHTTVSVNVSVTLSAAATASTDLN